MCLNIQVSIFFAIFFTSHNCALLGDNNACETLLDYSHLQNNPKCFHNSDMALETPDLIEKYTKALEVYKIITEDGYILTMFRIRRMNPRGTILLQHPLICNSRIYVGQGNESLAFDLWREGYDVWLNNNRGTLFSDEHVNVSINNASYWDFSFHEMALYDVPKQVDLIKRETNDSKIIYIGHSMGSTIGLIYLSMHHREAAASIKAAILMAPAFHFKYATSVLAVSRRFSPIFEEILANLTTQLGSVLVVASLVMKIPGIIFRSFPLLLMLTNLLLSAIGGWTPNETDPSLLNFDISINVKNFSWKTILHFLQLIIAQDRFQMFDYGRGKNLLMYGTDQPPLYPIGKIQNSIWIVSSADDSLTTLKDAEALFEQLSKKAAIYGHLKLKGINHLQYHIGRRRKTILIDRILNFLHQL